MVVIADQTTYHARYKGKTYQLPSRIIKKITLSPVTVQYFSELDRQRPAGERLAEEIHPILQNPLLGNDICGVSGHE